MNLIEVTNDKQFHELRRTCIGGSDAAAVLGLSEYKTAFDVYCEKRGLVEPTEPTEAMTMGNIMEPLILDQFEKLSGLTFKRHIFGRSESHPFVGCNFDGIGDSFIVEAKNVGNFSAREWGANGTDEIPDRYNLQVQHAMFVAGVTKGYLMAFLGGNRRGFFEVNYRPELMASALEAYDRFWTQVKEGIAPEITGADSVKETLARLYPKSSGETMQADNELEGWMAERWYADKAVKEAEKEKQRLDNLIKSRLANAEALVGDFGKLLWSERTSAATLDQSRVSALPADIQEAIRGCMREGTTYRHFQAYFKKGYQP